MEFKTGTFWKSPIALITYGIILYLGLNNIGVILHALGMVISVLSPFLAGIALAYALNLLLTFYEERVFNKVFKGEKGKGRRRGLCITLTYITVFAGVTLILMFVIPQLSDSISALVKNIPEYQKKMEALIVGLMEQYDVPKDVYSDIIGNWRELLQKAGNVISNLISHMVYFMLGVTNRIVNAVLAIVFSLYILMDKEKLIKLMKKALRAFTPLEVYESIMSVARIANDKFSHFIAGQLIEALIIGVLCFAGMLILSIPYALLVSTIIAVTALIPIFGAFIGTIPSAFIIFMVSPVKALWFVIFIIILQQFEGNFIYPKVVGGSLGISGMWVILAMIIGGTVAGFAGILLGIPTFAVLFEIFERATKHRLAALEMERKKKG